MNLLYNNYTKYGIYLHIPFCRRRCVYCDFYFEIGRSNAKFQDFILAEWEARKSIWPHQPQTLYFGGGTPSLLQPSQIETLIQALAPKAREITLEANPEDLTPDYLRAILAAGVNRLSLGVQSFEDSVLKYLGRKHRSEQAKRVILDAQDTGFSRISVDLIAGVEGETLGPSLEWLHKQKIGHISAYLLTVEPKTPLDKLIQTGRLQAPSDEHQTDAYIFLQEQLLALGYEQYEVSSYAIPGQESQHNRIYWGQGIYLGLGPGAHSMQLLADGSVLRRHTQARLGEWQADPTKASYQEELLAPQEALLEALAFGLRDLQAGICPEALAQRHQSELPKQLENLWPEWIDCGWLMRSSNRSNCHPGLDPGSRLDPGSSAGATTTPISLNHYFLTPLGARFADAVARGILTIASPPATRL